MKIRSPYLYLGLAAALIFAADQLMKWWVVNSMVEGESIEVFPPLLRWYFIRNPGAAFSIGEDFTVVFTIIMVLVSLAILFFTRKVRSVWWALALGLILGGALGNLMDRLFREPGFGFGHVVDYVSVPNFAIFNFADVGVSCGVGLIIVLTVLGISWDGERNSAQQKTASES